MAQFYTDPSREGGEHTLPDAETFEVRANSTWEDEDGNRLDPGWYWWPCFPGCLPDGDPNGPFASEEEAIADAREGME